MKKSSLWTKDFTIITLGTVVSMLGNAVSGFAIGILILDFTEPLGAGMSAFLYALFMVVYSIPKLIMPLLAGPYLDKYSRKKAIYTLDFISSTLYLIIFLMIIFGFLDNYSFIVFAILLVLAFTIGSIDSIYQVAYDSLYPNLVPEGYFSKAYSISSLLYPISAIMVPIAVFMNSMGLIAWLFVFNAVSFLTAAVLETQITGGDTHTTAQKAHTTLAEYKRDFADGIRYIIAEKGLLIITVFFFINNLCMSGSAVLILPYFKNLSPTQLFGTITADGYWQYIAVMAFGILGRALGGTLHYKIVIPQKLRYRIAMVSYTVTTIVEGVYLFCPIPTMMLLLLISGTLAVTSYNIRIASTQAYVPDDHRARFNSVFQMIFSLGGIIGQLAAGGAVGFLPSVGVESPTRGIIIGLMVISLISVPLVMGIGKKYVTPIYNKNVDRVPTQD